MNEFITKFMESPEFFYETIAIVVAFIFSLTIIIRWR